MTDHQESEIDRSPEASLSVESEPAALNDRGDDAIIVAAQFSGPLPPPAVLAGYEEVLPGAAERILVMAEEQSAHRKEMEKQTMLATARLLERGQLFGLIIGLAGIIGGSAVAALGQPWAGAAIGGGSLVSLVAVFVYGRRGEDEDDREAQEAPQQDE